jgi:AraC-like DNA-binding protein
VSPDAGQFKGSIQTALIGPVAVSDIRAAPLVVSRSAKHISRQSLDFFTMGMLLEGSGVITQRGREARFGPGDLILSDGSEPYRIRLDQPFRQLVLTLDRRRLEARLPQAARRTAVAVDGQTGPGRVAGAYLRALLEQVPNLGIAEDALGECTLDLVALAFGGEPMAAGPASDGDERLLLGRIKAFIEAHLGNPELSPDFIATRHGISRRYLYGLFESVGHSVSEYFWMRRLQRCREALTDPNGLGRNISEIAFEWGFNDASHFSRVFRRAYGMSPRDYRLKHP